MSWNTDSCQKCLVRALEIWKTREMFSESAPHMGWKRGAWEVGKKMTKSGVVFFFMKILRIPRCAVNMLMNSRSKGKAEKQRSRT